LLAAEDLFGRPHKEAIMSTTKTPPVHEVRAGRIRAAIWANPSDKGVRHSVTFSRLYKDADEWKDSQSFGRDDLLLLAKVIDKAHSWIIEQATPELDTAA
jgi:hypothetical protein